MILACTHSTHVVSIQFAEDSPGRAIVVAVVVQRQAGGAGVQVYPQPRQAEGGFAKPLRLRLLTNSSALKLGRWECAKVSFASAPCIANQVVAGLLRSAEESPSCRLLPPTEP
jgi:hypothetical protein